MKWFGLIWLAAAASQLAGSGAAAERAASDPEVSSATVKVPPVLRASEPPDSGQITLPGPAPVAPAVTRVVAVPPPVAKPSPIPKKLVEDAALVRPLPVPYTVPASGPPIAPSAAGAPVAAQPTAVAEIGREVAAYCQKQIGRWKESDARKVLGEPTRRRPAYDEKKVVNGIIYAFTDPTNKYKEIELDFAVKTGTLRTVFAYPPRLTWQECRQRWTGPVAPADAPQGRKFYSYTNRRLDVLVDPTGKVISLGWY